jgi:hypothetical protein
MRVNATAILDGREFFLKLLAVCIRLINREGNWRRRGPDITNEMQNAQRFSGSVEQI